MDKVGKRDDYLARGDAFLSCEEKRENERPPPSITSRGEQSSPSREWHASADKREKNVFWLFEEAEGDLIFPQLESYRRSVVEAKSHLNTLHPPPGKQN